MQYDNSGSSRRTVLRGAACLGLLGVYRALIAPPAHTPGPTPGPAIAARSDHARKDAEYAYRLRPLAGTARMPGPARPGQPVAPRAAAHRTLREPGKRIALTFDDGPHPTQTARVLRILRRYDTRATFFVIGENARWNPDLVKAIAADGHTVANHSWSHPRLDRSAAGTVRAELGRTCDLIERSQGAPPRFARAPYGAWHRISLRICAELGIEPMGWSVDTLDWDTPGTGTIRARVLTGAHPGAIVLAHDGGGDRSQTIEALAYYLPRLLDRGYTMVRFA